MGTVYVQIITADVRGFLTAANDRGLELRNVEMSDPLTVRFELPGGSMKILSRLAARRGEKLTILVRRGLWWKLAALKNRPVLAAGIFLIAFLTFFLPSRVLLVEVEGNNTIPGAQIRETAEHCGIGFWSSRREVRSERVKNALLEAMPELRWAGVNTYGSRAVISVRERAIQPEEGTPPVVSSIVACRDGFILTCQTERGTALCAPGQTVTEGQVLISGVTDCGICVTRLRASGEVFAATNRQINAVTPAKCLKISPSDREKVTWSLIIGKNRINFYKSSGISPSTCGRMVTEYTLTLPGGFALPVKLLKETVSQRTLTESDVEEPAAAGMLTAFARDQLSRQMIAGTVTASLETVSSQDGCYRLAGNYACTEMIGRERAEQNGELHETSGTNRQRGPGR